jgi:hypothetical protein
LIAAKLNAGCAHTDSSCVASAIARLRIDGCVRIRLGAMSKASSPAWTRIPPTYKTLTDYDARKLCAPPRRM